MKKLLTAALLVATVSGCATVQNEDGTTKKTAKYGAGAALAGAVAGALLGGDNRGKGALVGAAVAGAAGAGYGYYVDKQEAALRESMKGTGVQVERQGDQLNIVMPGSITFATGKAEIQPSFYYTLNQLSNSFREYQDSELVITGHTDSVGNYDANQVLSNRRADSVAQYLRSNGIDSSRLQTVGAGSTLPVASNETTEGRAQNRRVEIKLVPRPGTTAARG
ncbi:Outer membrane protein OmpA [Pseudomonas peli]|uniref:Outer membrane protein OmpA n=1 Tax=Pseudomonas peli TaxID=592361 RepID=A0A1G4U8Z5_9PSED|nr:OmpA family protein [Pseudomonas peli]NMZ71334.1 OmpA family protein [Pseudomonas peli]NMZ71390.1 OmpA family protein [Pseudomonas peli]SCW89239.1 Outer membrane protein OmpA [Pseudomonas peli]